MIRTIIDVLVYGLKQYIMLVALGMALLPSANAGYSLISQAHAKQCSHYCSPEKSKPCGKGCISLQKTCRKSWTTACAGERPADATKGFENPKHVDKAPNK